ncbi:MAG: phage terminase large subunit [Vampirovibrionales bacterium]|jgi:PBSX family phage terminase large subunit|nr:phage terminase large subunit [Vampirovibrionales bacterium]
MSFQGIVPYTQFWDKQKQFIQRDADVDLDMCIYQGGYGSGKTFIGSLLGILLSNKYKGKTGLVVADTFTLLEETTLRAYEDHFEAFGWESGIHYIKRGGNGKARISFPQWDSHILFMGGRDPERLKSLNLAWCHMEEGSQLPEATFNMVLSRLRAKGVDCHRLFGTTNPQAVKGWIHKHFVLNGGRKELTGEDGKVTIINKRRIIAPTSDNKSLNESYVMSMKETFDDEYFRINVLGEDGDYASGLVCKTWTEANVSPTCEYDKNADIFLTCDFNVDPMCWGIAHYVNGSFCFFDEIAIENTTTHQASEEFAMRYKGHQGVVIVTGDASGQNRATKAQNVGTTDYTIILNTLSSFGYHRVSTNLPTSNGSIMDRIQAWNAAVCNRDGVRRVLVSPKCKKIIWNMENLKYINGTSVVEEPTTNQIDKDKALKFSGHMFDAVSYLINRYMPIKHDHSFHKKQQLVSVPYRTGGGI